MLTLRTIKGSPLTYTEMDDNLLYLESIAGGSGGIGIVEVTKSELDLLISNKELSVGSIYKISGIDSNLYDGNTIGWFSAITENKLDSDGIGMFYTPKYDKSTPGFGIVRDYNWWYNDTYGSIDRLNFSINIQSQVIWGGYLWNLNNYIDTTYMDYIVNDLELNSTFFVKIPYNDNDYNIQYDKIKYEYESDIIYSRTDGNNIVSCKPLLLQFGGPSQDGKNPIEYFQWGNLVDGTQRGNGLIYVENSLFNNINFSGSIQAYIRFENNSVQDYTNFFKYSVQTNISFDKSKQKYMYFEMGTQDNLIFVKSRQELITLINGSRQEDLYFTDSSQENIILNNGYQETFQFNNSNQQTITLEGGGLQKEFIFNNSNQSGIFLGEKSEQARISLTFSEISSFIMYRFAMNRFTFNNMRISFSGQAFDSLTNGNGYYNISNLSGFGSGYQMSIPDLTFSTNIFNGIPKEIIFNSSEERIRFYDSSFMEFIGYINS